MDRFPERHPYRCLPLAVANTFGWELLSPCDLKIEWNGGPNIPDIEISSEDGFALVSDFAVSNFAGGIVSFHTGYLFVTAPGWLLNVGGPVNEPKDGMAPLTGLIETEWLPYPFTMNWQLQRPGVHRIKKHEAFCHIMPLQVSPVLEMEPEILDITTDARIMTRLTNYRERRIALRKRQREQSSAEEGEAPSWTREYFQGELADGFRPETHYNKIRLKEPVDRRKQHAAVDTSVFGVFGYTPPKLK